MKKEYDFSKGRRGPVIRQRNKTRITIHLDDDVLEAFRARADAEGRGYQTMINEALRDHLGRRAGHVSAETIRRIVREELRKTG
ncbi:MAG: BrnA antitoxin family protein [Acidobacteria bacterium]|nr:BrnA antitoxin family protein [Acidobacteriota bacterium]